MREKIIRCPYCKKSYYRVGYTITTATYYPPIYKNGVNINPDKNISTTSCTCLNCHKDFSYKSQSGKVIEVLGG